MVHVFCPIDDVCPVVKVRWREDFIDGLSRVSLIVAGLMRDELLVRLSTHCLIKREHKVLVKLLLGLRIEIIVALQQCLFRPKVVFAFIVASLFLGRGQPSLWARSVDGCEGCDLFYDGLARVDLST